MVQAERKNAHTPVGSPPTTRKRLVVIVVVTLIILATIGIAAYWITRPLQRHDDHSNGEAETYHFVATVDQLLHAAQAYNASTIWLNGTVTGLHYHKGPLNGTLLVDSFQLCDGAANSSSSLVVTIVDTDHWLSPQAIANGSTVQAHGQFRFENGQWMLYIRPGTNDRVAVLAGPLPDEGYVPLANVATLVSNLTAYDSKLVNLTGIANGIEWVYDTPTTNAYAQKFYLHDANASTSAIVRVEILTRAKMLQELTITNGSEVRVLGRLCSVTDNWSIQVRTATDDQVLVLALAPPDDNDDDDDDDGERYLAIPDVAALITDPNTYSGKLVNVTGVATSFYWEEDYSNGSLFTRRFWLTNKERNASVKLYIGVKWGWLYEGAIYNGSVVGVKGTYQQYQGNWELYIGSDDEDAVSVLVLNRPTESHDYSVIESVTALLANPGDYRDTPINITGRATALEWLEDYATHRFFTRLFELTDTTGGAALKIYIGDRDRWVPAGTIYDGCIVTVKGTFQEYESTWELFIGDGDHDAVIVNSSSAQHSPGGGRIVLFDRTKYETAGDADWVVDGAYSSWADVLLSRGYDVRELTGDTITTAALTGVQVLIIPEPQDPFTTDERDTIHDFVRTGGGLIVIADHKGADRNNNGWDAVRVFDESLQLHEFEILFEDTNVDTESVDVIDRDHYPSLTAGVGAIAIYNGAALRSWGSAREMITYEEHALLVANTYGTGRILAFSDSSVFDDGSGNPYDDLHDGWSQYDHEQLAVNMVDWCAGGTS